MKRNFLSAYQQDFLYTQVNQDIFMQSQKYYYCNIEGLTDVGCKRPANEDWFDKFECQNGLVAVVCDGMGGHVGGAVASHTAVEAIRAFLEANYFENPNEAIVAAVNAGNQAILQRTQQQPELSGMGATCVILIVRDGYVYYGSVGDSRIYLVRQHVIKQLTKDQSFVQMLVDRGEITPEQAEHHPRKNEITNALGLPQMMPAVVRSEPVEPEAGDCFILCSDGLSGMVPDEKILEIAGSQAKYTQQERVQRLIEKARVNGGYDNITAVMVEFSLSPFKNRSKKSKGGAASPSAKPSRLLTIWLPVAVLCLALAGGAAWWFLRDSEPKMATADDYVKELMEKDKNSEVKLKIAEGDPDALVFKANQKFMTIEEVPNSFGVVSISWTTSKGEVKRIEGPKNLFKTLKVVPAENFNLTKTDSTKVELSFKDKLEGVQYVALVFTAEDGHTLHYTIGISVPKPSDYPAQNPEETKKKVKDIKDAFSDDKKETTETPTPLTKTTEIRADMVNEKGQINICLQTGEGKSNRSNIYVGKDLKFSTKGNSVKETAYHISCPNENVVNITVYYNEFKKDSEKITLFLADQKQFTLIINKK